MRFENIKEHRGEFYQFLRDDSRQDARMAGFCLFKVRRNNGLIFLYRKYAYGKEDYAYTFEDLKFGGVFNPNTDVFYPQWYELYGISDDDCTLDQMRKRFSTAVSDGVNARIDESHGMLFPMTFNNKYEMKDHESYIDELKHNAPKTAARRIVTGVRHRPYHCNLEADILNDRAIVEAIIDFDSAVEKAVNQFIEKHAPSINCHMISESEIQAQIRALTENLPENVRIMKTIRSAVIDMDAKKLTVEIDNESGDFISVKLDRDLLLFSNNDEITKWYLTDRERDTLKSIFGSYRDIQPSDIASIQFRGKTIYKRTQNKG